MNRLSELVYQAIGEASTCWSDLGTAGVFHDQRAKEIGEKLIVDLERLSREYPRPQAGVELDKILCRQELRSLRAHGDLETLA